MTTPAADTEEGPSVTLPPPSGGSSGPGLPEWMRRYDRHDLGDDLVAGLVVAMLLLPQSLAYAMLAGLPPQAGLYASMLPLVAYALFGSSRVLAIGPAAIISLMTAAALKDATVAFDVGVGTAAIWLALLTGGMQLAFGLLRLGFLSNLLSHAVISGFISAAAVVIAFSQLGHLFGFDPAGIRLPEMLMHFIGALGDAHLLTFAVGAVTLAFLLGVLFWLEPALAYLGVGQRSAAFISRLAPLVAVLLALVAAAMLGLGQAGVPLLGHVPAGLPRPTFLVPQFDLLLRLLPSALLIALLGFAESISVAQSLAMRRRERIRPNRELVGLGMANLAAGASGAMPVTGSLSRSVVSYNAGAATPAAGVCAALVIAIVAVWFAPWLADLPRAVLAAIIIVAVLSLVDVRVFRRTLRHSPHDFVALLLTVFGVFLLGVETGLILGLASSILLYLWRSSRPHIAVVGRVPGTEHFRNVARYEVETLPHVLTVRVDESLFFANARYLEERILELVAKHPQVEDLVLQCSAVNGIDGSALEVLASINERLHLAGVRFHLSEVKGPVMDVLARSDLIGHLSGRIFFTQNDAFRELSRTTDHG